MVTDRVDNEMVFFAFVDPVTGLIGVGQSSTPRQTVYQTENRLRRELDMMLVAKPSLKRTPWRFIKRTQHPEDPHGRWYKFEDVEELLGKVEADPEYLQKVM